MYIYFFFYQVIQSRTRQGKGIIFVILHQNKLITLAFYLIIKLNQKRCGLSTLHALIRFYKYISYLIELNSKQIRKNLYIIN